MKIQRLITASVILGALLFTVSAQSRWWPFSDDENNAMPQGEIVDILWEDLIPDDFVQPVNPFSTMTQEEIDKLMDGSEESQARLAKLQAAFNYAPVVNELNGKRVKIPAYITPLEYNSDSLMKEFLLVPYVGACMHTPPPPANQIVHATSSEAVKVGGIYEPVWAIGVIRTETVKSDLAESGYKLDVEKILPYSAE